MMTKIHTVLTLGFLKSIFTQENNLLKTFNKNLNTGSKKK